MFEESKNNLISTIDKEKKFDDEYFNSFARIICLLCKENFLKDGFYKIGIYQITIYRSGSTIYLEKPLEKIEIIKKIFHKDKEIKEIIFVPIISYKIYHEEKIVFDFNYSLENIEHLKDAFMEFQVFLNNIIEKRQEKQICKEEFLSPVKNIVSAFIQLENELKEKVYG